MPAYRVDINHIVTAEEVEQMMSKSQYPMHRAMIAALYLSGGRVSEVCGLRLSSFNIGEELVTVTMETKKLGKTNEFIIRTRKLEFTKDAPFLADVLEYLAALTEHGSTPEQRIFPVTVRTIGKTVERLSERRFCPMNFRHSRMTKLANEGVSLGELMGWKGAKDARSVSPYLAGKPIGRRLKIT